MQVGMHQLGNLLAVGALATGVRPEFAVFVMLTMLAAEILQVGPRQLKAAVALVANKLLCVAHTPAVDHSSEAIDDISLSYNIFKLHILSH